MRTMRRHSCMPLLTCELQDASFGWVYQICGFAFACDNSARTLHGRDRRFQMEFSMVVHVGDGEGRGLRGCRIENFLLRSVIDVVQTRTGHDGIEHFSIMTSVDTHNV